MSAHAELGGPFEKYQQGKDALPDGRRVSNWYLLTADGRQVLAAVGVESERRDAHYHYRAQAPFDQDHPLNCNNQGDVKKWLASFVEGGPPPPGTSLQLPDRRESTIPPSPRDSGRLKTESGILHRNPPQPLLPTRPPSARAAAQAAASTVAAAMGQLEPPHPRDRSFISNPAQRRAFVSEALRNVEARLNLLCARTGVQYSLTTVTHEREVRIMGSSGVTFNAPAGKHNVRPREESEEPEPSRKRPKPIANGTAGASGGRPARRAAQASKQEDSDDSNLGLAALLHAAAGQNREGSVDDSGPPAPAAPAAPKISRAQQAAAAAAAANTDPDLRAMLPHISGNEEPQMPGLWRREPWAEHPYEPLSAYQVASEGGEEVDKRALFDKLNASLSAQDNTSVDYMVKNRVLIADKIPLPLQEGEYKLSSVWGVDRFTRSNIFAALGQSPAMAGGGDYETTYALRNDFIDHQLLPACNVLGEEGWDIMAALQNVRTAALKRGDAATADTCKTLARVAEATERHFKAAGRRSGLPLPPGPIEDRDYFRIWPKGQGVICRKPGGVPAFSFIGEYLGEMYAPWAWSERQQSAPGRGGAVGKRSRMRPGLPEFYNTVLERPQQDPAGYDIIHIDAAQRGNFTARLAHCCLPTCKAIPMVTNGRLTLGIYTTVDVAEGEEFTLDYEAETESEKEQRQAICLCGSVECRGSFLYFTNPTNNPTQQVMASNHTFLDRNALLLRAASEVATEEDFAMLSAAGLRKSVLCSRPDGRAPLPSWVVHWAALVLKWIDSEHASLPRLLTQDPSLPEPISEEDALVEVKELRATRLQALVAALDKAKLFLRRQPREIRKEGPLRLLKDEEVCEYLWTASDSIANRVSELAKKQLAPEAHVRHPNMLTGPTASRGQRRPAPPPDRHLESAASSGRIRTASGSMTPQAKRPRGRPRRQPEIEIPPEDDEQDEAESEGLGEDEAAAEEENDAPAAETPTVEEPPVVDEAAEAAMEAVDALLEGHEVNSADDARQGLRKLALLLQEHGPGHAAMHDLLILLAETRHFITPTAYESFQARMWSIDPAAPKPSAKQAEAYRYRAGFLWGTLSGWPRAANADALVALGVDRRGCLSLPDPDCCYLPAFSSGKYCREGERDALLNMVARSPSSPWSSGSNWSFRNQSKVYGSPMFDVVLSRHGVAGVDSNTAAASACMQSVIQELRDAFKMPSS